MAKFTVDTHLFRELGELLVSRESTALVELIKNSYDADATQVTVYGENLDEPAIGKIILVDNGNGMTPEIFRDGFLRIASRSKDGKKPRSPVYGRRFTGAKGVGRLAAHKLAWRIDVKSIPNPRIYGAASGVEARIDWKMIESVQSLEDVEATNGVVVQELLNPSGPHGTTIQLSLLKKRWTEKQRFDFFSEIESFLPPDSLLTDVSKLTNGTPLFSAPVVRDQSGKTGFDVIRTGDLDVGDQQHINTAASADWIVEVDADPSRKEATVNLLPTRKFSGEFPDAVGRRFTIPMPEPADVAFQARVLFQAAKSWPRSGVRIYQEGFRVLPYGEQRNDWLELDEDYKRRGRNLRFLANVPNIDMEGDKDKDLGLSIAGNSSYFGAIFFTSDKSRSLRMLVNREGFEWSASFESVKDVVRTALDLLVRERAAYTLEKRTQRRTQRKAAIDNGAAEVVAAREIIIEAKRQATSSASRASALIESGNHRAAIEALQDGVGALESASSASEQLLTDVHATRLLAALGLQLSAYIHEINALMVMIRQVADFSADLRREVSGSPKTLAIRLDNRIGDLKRSIEKQAQYLADVTSPDAKRRRSRQPIRDKFESALRLYEHEAARNHITLLNEIPPDLKTPVPMFSAELMLVFSNLLSNAIKAAGLNGKVRISAGRKDDRVVLRIENTGVRVDVSEGERWFKPFQSTTAVSDVFLGQGMGMGLPISREMLEDYGANLRFVRPSNSYSTAVELSF